ncbi:MAG: rhodanese-like domain-containing protein [Flavobacteriales bacterium]|nr:rhodanese-like domain-containing protein [Flavobacteriales bacterium]
MKYTFLSALMIAFLFACGGNETPPPSNDVSEGMTQTEAATITKDVDPTTFQELMNSKSNALILDVRTPEEVDAGMIANAEHRDFYDDDFKTQLEGFDKSRPVLVYCAAGGRSGKAMDIMQEMGFKEVYNLDGGYRAWKNNGLPTTK